MLAWLASVFEQLSGAGVTPPCPGCGAVMALRCEDAVGAFGEAGVRLQPLRPPPDARARLEALQPWAVDVTVPSSSNAPRASSGHVESDVIEHASQGADLARERQA